MIKFLAGWGACPNPCSSMIVKTPDDCAADINRDCAVDIVDLIVLLAEWGPCEPGALPPASGQPYDDNDYGTISDWWGQTPEPDPQLICQVAAEDFKTTTSDPVTRVFWWGFYEDAGADCTSGYTDDFIVTYYQSILHPTTGKAVPDSTPGGVIASFNQSVSRMQMPDPLPNGNPLYLYTLDHAPVTLAQDGCYWVEIKNNGGDLGPTGCHWYWSWSDEQQWRYSAFKIGTSDVNYVDMGTPAHASNLSFGLNVSFTRESPATNCSQ